MTAATKEKSLNNWPYNANNMLPFIDVKTQQNRIRKQIDAAFHAVIDSGAYIMGPQVQELEAKLGEMTQTTALGCASGTDALLLALMAFDVEPGDAVFVPSFTFAATAEVVKLLHATPVFIDILEDTYCMSPQSLSEAIEAVKAKGDLNPKAVIAVDLFGQPADYNAIRKVCEAHSLKLIADCAQSCGAYYKGKPVETYGDMSTTSFYPAKPLGCYGDGGAVFVPNDNQELAQKVRSLRVHGEGRHRYEHIRVGMTGRLDTLQAAFLIEKLSIFKEECALRQNVADHYNAGLACLKEHGVVTPYLPKDCTSVWAQYTLQVPNRTELQNYLKEKGIPTGVYYPIPLHKQLAYQNDVCAPAGLSVTEKLAEMVLSLPMHPYLSKEDIEGIVFYIKSFFNK